MANFDPPATVPEKFNDRKAATATGPTSIMIPLKGVSAIDQTGKAFNDPAARQALYDGIRATHGDVELIELDGHINDPAFAEAAATRLLQLLAPSAG